MKKENSEILATKKAILREPINTNNYIKLATLFKSQGKKTHFFRSYKIATERQAKNAELLLKAGISEMEVEKFNEALILFTKSARTNNQSLAWFHLGICLFALGEYSQSLRMYRLSIQHLPGHVGTLMNIGVLLQLNNKPRKAARSYEIALTFEPDNAGLHYNKATALLSSGQYLSGWKHFRWRFENPSTSAIHALPHGNKWKGENLEPGQRLGIISEQGLGDTIQFIRYCATLRARGISIKTFIQKSLVSLVRESGLDPECQENTIAENSEIDTWIPLLSIPEILGVTPNNPIISSSYITTRKDLITKWCNRFSKSNKFKVGIKWQGFQGNERLYNQSIGRSIPLSKFKALADNFEIEFISLQKDEGSEQISTCGFDKKFTPLLKCTEKERCMLETAAIIASCDLILTCDSVIAHLAGALGAPTWVLLNSCPEWRWGDKGNTTFWYPTAKLFRQKEQGDWSRVIQDVANSLSKHI